MIMVGQASAGSRSGCAGDGGCGCGAWTEAGRTRWRTPRRLLPCWRRAQQVVDALAPWANGRQYLNFAEHAVDVATGYRPLDWARLQAVRAAVDPAGLLKAHHQVPAGRIPAQR